MCFVIFTLSIFSCVKTQYNTIEDAITATNAPRISKEQKQWLLGLSAIIMEVNKSSHTTLEVEPISEKATRNCKKILEKWWGINNRDELVAAIKRLENGGHNETYKKLNSILKSDPDQDIEFIYYNYKLSRKEVYYYIFLRDNYDTTVNTNILSWDLGRATSLVRWGYQVDYLTEAEAWNILLYFGRLIQRNYNSWEEYGDSYSYGRVFWSSGFGKAKEYYFETKKTLDILFSDNGLWKILHWDDSLF